MILRVLHDMIEKFKHFRGLALDSHKDPTVLQDYFYELLKVAREVSPFITDQDVLDRFNTILKLPIMSKEVVTNCTSAIHDPQTVALIKELFEFTPSMSGLSDTLLKKFNEVMPEISEDKIKDIINSVLKIKPIEKTE